MIDYSLHPADMRDELEKAIAYALKEGIRFWHRTYAKGHFTHPAKGRYRYKKRKSEDYGKGRDPNRAWRGRRPMAKKTNPYLLGAYDPEFEQGKHGGTSMRQLLQPPKPRATRRFGRGRVVASARYRAPRYFWIRPVGKATKQPDKAAEFMKTLPRQHRRIWARVSQVIEQRMAKATRRRRRRIG
jgi:hypothetical protein